MLIAVTLKQLKAINENSIKHDYNRNLEWAEFERVFKRGMKKRGMWKGASSTYVLLKPLMMHADKHFEECASHMRCQIFTDEILGFLMIDVVFEDYERLMLTNKTFKGAA